MILPFGLLPFEAAYYAFLTLKVAATVAFLLVARGFVPEREAFGGFLLFACFAFNAALGFDLRAGNVATIEALLLLLAFRALKEDRNRRFSLLVLVAGMFKILPAMFLCLLLCSRHPQARRVFVVGALIAMVLFCGPLVVVPGLEDGLTTIAKSFDSLRGPIDSSLFALSRDLTLILLGWSDGWVAATVYVISAGALMVPSVRAASNLRRIESDQLIPIHFLVLTYGLLVPRMITYSFSLLLIPAFVLLTWLGWTSATRLVCAAALVPTQQILWRMLGRADTAPVGPLWMLPIEYWNWLVLLAIWLLVLRRILGRRFKKSARVGTAA